MGKTPTQVYDEMRRDCVAGPDNLCGRCSVQALAFMERIGMYLAAGIVDECARGEHGALANASRAIRDAAKEKETP